ncbi:MAG: hypothetical protein K6G57_05525 [Lachnospiraceae bacterium]|nr:hypothetical protein [Lachnospiraceae bacterium]
MAMNPMEMMKIAERFRIFKSQHPKVPAFVKQVLGNAVCEGTVAELKVTTPDGKEYVTNMKITAEDLETIEIMKNLGGTGL